MKKHFFGIFVLLASNVFSQDVSFEVKDQDIFSVRYNEYQPSGFAFFRESSDSAEKNRLKHRTQAWNATMEFAQQQGCLYVARTEGSNTERERRLRWEAVEEMERKGQHVNAAHEKSRMIRVSSGRVFFLRLSVEEALYRDNDFICLREAPAHKVVPAAFGTPAELMR